MLHGSCTRLTTLLVGLTPRRPGIVTDRLLQPGYAFVCVDACVDVCVCVCLCVLEEEKKDEEEEEDEDEDLHQRGNNYKESNNKTWKQQQRTWKVVFV